MNINLKSISGSLSEVCEGLYLKDFPHFEASEKYIWEAGFGLNLEKPPLSDSEVHGQSKSAEVQMRIQRFQNKITQQNKIFIRGN